MLTREIKSKDLKEAKLIQNIEDISEEHKSLLTIITSTILGNKN